MLSEKEDTGVGNSLEKTFEELQTGGLTTESKKRDGKVAEELNPLLGWKWASTE